MNQGAMKIVLATFGSRGDVQPMLALSLALRRAGHEVLLAAPPEKAARAAQLGCPFQPLGADVTAFIDSMRDAHSLRSTMGFMSFLRRETACQFEVLPKILAGADLVVGASLVAALSSVAESMGVAYRYVAFTPQLVPSASHPFLLFKHQGLPKPCNRLGWRLAGMVDKLNLTRLINIHRKTLGLAPVQDAWRHILGRNVIVASDRAVAEVPGDAEVSFTQTGYLHLNESHPGLPDLETFLEAGPPPVYAGFGSMPGQDQARNVSMIVEAARRAGRRLVMTKFWNEPSEFSKAGDVFFIQKYPHLKLFPRMAAVIHHGGAGTTASGAAGGVPQIIVPHILDQYYWGHQVHRSGLGPKPLRRSRLTAKKLARRIQQCLSSDAMRQRAQEVAAAIRPEHSLSMTVQKIGDVVDKLYL
jgi:UDP:flavonoid glycosyltransferase YjiC (YdhE family)